jgi:hypothetical protein
MAAKKLKGTTERLNSWQLTAEPSVRIFHANPVRESICFNARKTFGHFSKTARFAQIRRTPAQKNKKLLMSVPLVPFFVPYSQY